MANCRNCGVSVPMFSGVGGYCPTCHFAAQRGTLEKERDELEVEPTEDELAAILLTTENAPTLAIAERIEIISAEFAIGMGLLTDVFNAWRDVFGGRSKSYQSTLKDGRKAVLQELRREAFQVGANAVVAVNISYSEISGGGKSMMFMVATGTAVRIAQAQ